LAAASGSVDLQFKSNRWRVNDTWDADAQMIKVLFATVRQVEPRRPVAVAARDSVRSMLERNGITVSLFAGNEKKLSFRMGGNDIKTETWFLKDGDTQPYLMTIPGYRVYVGGIFELPVSGWRNKRIFDFNWRNFKSLSATYTADPRQNFDIEMQGRYFGIKNLAAADTAKLNTYLDALSLLMAERFIITRQASIDSLLAGVPLARIEIKDIASRSYQLDVYTSRKSVREVVGRLGNGDVIVLGKEAASEVVKKKDYFRVP
jgi:hypothetical protein